MGDSRKKEFGRSHFCYIIVILFINIVDSILWLPVKIPILNSVLKFIKTCPDKDLVTYGVDTLINWGYEKI